MTERPHPTVRGPGLVVTVMLMLLLAASALFSAAAPHHHAGVHTSAACVDQHHTYELAHEHEHQHGNDWTPRLNQRARLANDTAVPYPRCEVVLPSPASTVPGVALSRLGVLRV